MATLTEIVSLWANDDLKTKTEGALTVIAEEVRLELDSVPNHANRIKLAKKVLDNPQTYRDDFLRAMIAQNRLATSAVIQGAADSQIELAVRNAWNIFADGT